MTIRERAPCAHCGNHRRKPLPLGPVAGLPPETALLPVCRPCRRQIAEAFAATRAIRVRLQIAAEDAAALAAG